VGALGDCCRLSLRDGQPAWRINILKKHNAPNTEWAVTSSPLVVDDLVVLNPGGPRGDGLAAYHRDTGKLVWAAEGVKGHQAGSISNRPGYSTPMLVNLLGVRQILMFDGTGLRGYVPETGQRLWEYAHENGAGVNVAQPILFDDGRIFISCSYDLGCAMVQVKRDGDAWSTSNLWKSPNLNLRCKFTSPVLHDGFLYGLDEGILVCLDPATGERKWKKGRYGHGQLLLTNGQLLVHTEDGRAGLIDPNPKGLREVTSFRTLDDAKNWNPPALVRGTLYVRNHHEMAAFDLAGRSK
jgi:outer membrane protein assembly factor BamB